jgi:hypothetical protein
VGSTGTPESAMGRRRCIPRPEARWAAVQALAAPQDSPEVYVAIEVFELLVDSDVADLDWRGTHLSIDDVSRLAELGGVLVTDLTSDPVGFDEDGRLITLAFPLETCGARCRRVTVGCRVSHVVHIDGDVERIIN